jgi:hypothetical protein
VQRSSSAACGTQARECPYLAIDDHVEEGAIVEGVDNAQGGLLDVRRVVGVECLVLPTRQAMQLLADCWREHPRWPNLRLHRATTRMLLCVSADVGAGALLRQQAAVKTRTSFTETKMSAHSLRGNLLLTRSPDLRNGSSSILGLVFLNTSCVVFALHTRRP